MQIANFNTITSAAAAQPARRLHRSKLEVVCLQELKSTDAAAFAVHQPNRTLSALPDRRCVGTYVLHNRPFVGELAYRGKVHAGEQEPMLDLGLFEAVQAKLAARAVAR